MSDTGGRQVRPTRYRPIPDNAYDPRITDLSRPLNSGNPPLIGFCIVLALFIVFTHRSNIARLRAGNENRVRRLWLLRPREK